jgi:hypothetical protein
MPKPDNHPTKKPAWLLGGYIIAAFVVAIAIIFAVSYKHGDRASAPTDQH